MQGLIIREMRSNLSRHTAARPYTGNYQRSNYQGSIFHERYLHPYYAQDSAHGYATDQWLLDDMGKVRYKDLNLSSCISVVQAQRCAKVELLRNRYQGSGTLTMTLEAYQMMPCDIMQMNFSTLGWTNKVLEVTGVRFVMDKGSSEGAAPSIYVAVDVQETGPDIYTWEESEEQTIYGVSVVGANIPNVVGPPVSVILDAGANTAVTGADGVVTPRISVTWNDPEDVAVTQIQMQYQKTGTSTWTDAGLVDVANFQGYISGVVAGQSYNVRIRSLRANGAASIWVEQDSYTVSATYSYISSRGINSNSPYNVSNDAVVDSIDESGTATVRIYGPGGVGTSWDLITGAGTVSESAGEITGLDYSTVYYIVMDQSGDYYALTDYNSSLDDSYISVGSVATVASGGTGGTSGGGSSGGGSGGPRSPIACTLEGTALDTPDGPLDNRIVYAEWASGQPVYLMGLDEPEKIVHAEWVDVADIYEVTVGARKAFRCSGSHTLKHEGQYRWTETLPEHCFLNTRDDLEPATIRRIDGATGRVLRLELEGPSHEYSAHGVLTHNVKTALPA